VDHYTEAGSDPALFVGNPLQGKELITKRARNSSFQGLLEGDVSLSKFCWGLGFLSAAYGGLHASEWNAFFPTQLECYMWRLSAVVVPAAGFAAAGIVLGVENVNWEPIRLIFRRVKDPLDDLFHALMGPPSRDMQFHCQVLRVLSKVRRNLVFGLVMTPVVLCGIIFWSFIILYISCRLYLVVGAYVSIRELPLDAYRTPEWSQLLPHL